MDAALRKMTAESLRPRGFTGSIPHLRRRRDNRVELVSVQYHSAGGSFVVEVAACGPEGYTTSWGKAIPATKVRAVDIPHPNRPRLGSPNFPLGDHWFVFVPRSYDADAEVARSDEQYTTLATDVARLIERQAEPWWSQSSVRIN
jgi:Domain of unknown function (DUF4304)